MLSAVRDEGRVPASEEDSTERLRDDVFAAVHADDVAGEPLRLVVHQGGDGLGDVLRSGQPPARIAHAGEFGELLDAGDLRRARR